MVLIAASNTEMRIKCVTERTCNRGTKRQANGIAMPSAAQTVTVLASPGTILLRVRANILVIILVVIPDDMAVAPVVLAPRSCSARLRWPTVL